MKKSSYSKKIVKLLKKEYKEDLEKSKIKTELNSSADSKYQTHRSLLKQQNETSFSQGLNGFAVYVESVDSIVFKGPN